MTGFFQQAWVIYRKDLLLEMRGLSHLLSTLLFGVLLFLLFSFALSVDPDLMRRMAPGLFWLTILFASLLSLDHSFHSETEDEQWEGLLLAGMDPKALYLGKLLTNLSLVLLLQLLLLPLMAILFDLSLTLSLGVIIFLGSLGVTTLGTLYAGITATFHERQMLLPLLLFPMLVPVLLAAVKVTELTLAHDLFGQQVAWIKLLLMFDILFFLGSILSAGTLFEGV